jgi:hypothetical protein
VRPLFFVNFGSRSFVFDAVKHSSSNSFFGSTLTVASAAAGVVALTHSLLVLVPVLL